MASACVRGKARLSLEGFRCCLALLPVVYVSHVVTRLFRPQLAGESERQLHVHLQEDSTAISRHTGVPGIRLLSCSRTVPAALPLVDSCEGGSGAQRSRVTRSGSSLLGGRRGLEPPHARAPSPGGTAARAARSLSVSLVPPPCVVFVGAVPGRLGNKAEEPQVSAVRCLRTGGGPSLTPLCVLVPVFPAHARHLPFYGNGPVCTRWALPCSDRGALSVQAHAWVARPLQ